MSVPGLIIWTPQAYSFEATTETNDLLTLQLAKTTGKLSK